MNFKSFNVSFDDNPHDIETEDGFTEVCDCDDCDRRTNARFIIRGMLTFNDYELGADPW